MLAPNDIKKGKTRGAVALQVAGNTRTILAKSVLFKALTLAQKAAVHY